MAYGPVKTSWRKQIFLAVQIQRNQEMFLRINISRGQHLQQLIYSYFLQDYSSLSHPVRKLQVSGTARCAPQTKFTHTPLTAPC